MCATGAALKITVNTKRAAQAQFLHSLVSSTRLQLIVTISASILICLLIGGLHFSHRASYHQQANLTRSFREARLDLLMGIMHVENSKQANAPFEYGQGKALIRQAIRNFEKATNRSSQDVLRSGTEQVEQFRKEALELEAELTKPSSTPEELSQSLIALRIRFHQLSKLAELVDQDLQEELQNSSRIRSRAFLGVMLCSIVLLSVILLLVLIANNKVRASDKAVLLAQTEFRGTLELLHAIVDGTPDLVFVKGVNKTYILANRALAEFASRELDNIIGESDSNLFTADTATNLALHDDEVMESRLPISYEATFSFPAVEKTYSISKAPYLGSTGEVLGVIGICRDVTLNLHSQRMEVVGRLAGGIAHDFNNILTVINGHADLILGDPKLPGEHRVAVETILNAGRRAAGLTSQLLSFSRKAIIAPKVINLNESIRNSTTLLSRLITEDVHLSTQLCSPDPFIKIDPNQLDQVLMNLVVNAKDAMPSGGRLEIGTSVKRLPDNECFEDSFRLVDEVVEITVSDSGNGIPKDVLRHIFEPFFTTKSPNRGTGLGLAVVHGVIEHAGGKVTVESEVNRGTTFQIHLPIVVGQATEGTEELTSFQRQGRETILVVEDEESLGNLFELILKRQGYTVLRAADGAAAIQIFEQQFDLIDLLITDVILPGFSGHQLAQRIWAKSKDLPVIFMSGYTDDEVLRYGVREATDRFLQKPFTPDSLIRQIRSSLEAVRPASKSNRNSESPSAQLHDIVERESQH